MLWHSRYVTHAQNISDTFQGNRFSVQPFFFYLFTVDNGLFTLVSIGCLCFCWQLIVYNRSDNKLLFNPLFICWQLKVFLYIVFSIILFTTVCLTLLFTIVDDKFLFNLFRYFFTIEICLFTLFIYKCCLQLLFVYLLIDGLFCCWTERICGMFGCETLLARDPSETITSRLFIAKCHWMTKKSTRRNAIKRLMIIRLRRFR